VLQLINLLFVCLIKDRNIVACNCDLKMGNWCKSFKYLSHNFIFSEWFKNV